MKKNNLIKNISTLNKELYEYKLDLLYYGIALSNNCYNSLRKGFNRQVNNNDYITTKGLMIVLESQVYVNAMLNKKSPYKIDFIDDLYILYYNEEYICQLKIIQPPDFALMGEVLKNGRKITDLVNIHGDRIRIQPIQGCSNCCSFCDLNRLKYHLNSILDLDEAFNYAMKNVGFRHVLISGGTPSNDQKSFDYSNSVYKYFGEKYGKEYPIDVMLVPRGFSISDNSLDGYETFLRKLKDWNISGIYINLELYNDEIRKKYIPQKDLVGKENYFQFIKLAVKIFGQGNVKSCIIIGLEEIEDSLEAVEKISSLGCIPVLSPYIPNDKKTFFPKPEFMKKVLIGSQEIVDRYHIELGPVCVSCKHNTIHFK